MNKHEYVDVMCGEGLPHELAMRMADAFGEWMRTLHHADERDFVVAGADYSHPALPLAEAEQKMAELLAEARKAQQ